MGAKIFAVWTRPLDGVDRAGRVNVARRVRAALERAGEVTHARQHNVLEEGCRVCGVVSATVAFLKGLLRGRPLPLQCALFACRREGMNLAAAAAAYDVVYADGIRTLWWLRRLRRISPDIRVIVDLDDLMSFRCEQLRTKKLSVSLGYVEQFFPRIVVRCLASQFISLIFLSYESRTLRRAEMDVLQLADAVVLLNGREAALLARAAAMAARPVRAAICAIPPCVDGPSGVVRTRAAVWRAVFVGSDALVQNRLTIDYLLKCWERWHIPTTLTIYGRQRRERVAVANVSYRDYVEDIGEAYIPGSILVCPSFLRGGIKTKALEGFAYGVPVIGNDATFEGLGLEDYPLRINDETDLAVILRNPSEWAAVFTRACNLGRALLARAHTAEHFAARWQGVIAGRLPTGGITRPGGGVVH